VQRGPNGSFAFIVSGDSTNQTVKMRPITVAQIDNGEALIDDGLDAGEAVVVDGQYKLQDGSKVRSSAPAGGAGGSHRKRPDSGAGTNPVSAPTNTP